MERYLGMVVGKEVPLDKGLEALVLWVHRQYEIRKQQRGESDAVSWEPDMVNLDTLMEKLLGSNLSEGEAKAILLSKVANQFLMTRDLQKQVDDEAAARLQAIQESIQQDAPERSRKRRRIEYESDSDEMVDEPWAILEQPRVLNMDDTGSDHGTENGDFILLFGNDQDDDYGLSTGGEDDKPVKSAHSGQIMPFNEDTLPKHQVRGLVTQAKEDIDQSVSRSEMKTAAGKRLHKLLDLILKTHQKVVNRKNAPTPKHNTIFPRNKTAFYSLLWGAEEAVHPWFFQFPDHQYNERPLKMLYRTYDGSSQGQIRDPWNGFLAGTSTAVGELNTYEGRKRVLTLHSNFSNRRFTPPISCSRSFYDTMDNRVPFHEKRLEKRSPAQPLRLAVINVLARRRAGGSVFNMWDELQHYGVDPTTDPDIYKEEYFCLWQIPPPELVWNFWVRDIKKWKSVRGAENVNFMMEVIKPIYRIHERMSKQGKDPLEIKHEIQAFLEEVMPDAAENP